MARYYFDVNECGEITTDDEGQDCATLDDALDCAVKVARGIMAAEVMVGKLCLTCCVEIYDEGRALVQKMPFTFAIHVTGEISPPLLIQPSPRQ